MTPTRFPVRSKPSLGQRLVNNDVPAKPAIPGMSGSSGTDKIPEAATTNGAVNVSPASVCTDQTPAGSSNVIATTLVLNCDVAAKIFEPVGDEVQISLHLGLGRHRLRPHPFLLDLLGEAVRVLDAFDVTARARIAVVEPSPADVFGHLQHADPKAELTQPMQCVQAGKSRTNHERVEARITIKHCHR